MLNISDNKILPEEEWQALQSPLENRLSRWHLSLRNLLLVLLAVFALFLFLPWTQSVRANGKVTTLRPEQRPQTIHATIAGRIERWYVTEGQTVHKGDTILYLSEVKADYFDPALVERMGSQVSAKQGAIASYSGKVGALDQQMVVMRQELGNKVQQIRTKIQQGRLKMQSDSIEFERVKLDLKVAERQIAGTQALYEKGLKSLTELEDKRLKMQEIQAKLVSTENKFLNARNDLALYQTDLALTQNEYDNKIAKTQGDRFSTISDQYAAKESVNKLQIEQENYARRASFYYITAPQDGYIVQTLRPGLGEIIKEGDAVVSIQPAHYQLAVEMYVRPLDLPLLQVGQPVRFLFDGWPAFFFSGWPGVSLGSFSGQIVAMDRNISTNSKFRVLVAPDPKEMAWPSALQPGGGAKGIALLHNVPLWYELWRILNGFPPDLYQEVNGQAQKPGEDKSGK
ncbi:MAG: biotin/lipoyl-binding protein [Saprospiraceae bacterium]